jgi:hypothetical protein
MWKPVLMGASRRPSDSVGNDRSSTRAKRTLMALLLGTAVIVFVLTIVYHLGVPATVISILIGLPGLWLAWVTYRDSLRGNSGLSAHEMVDQLAITIKAQWEKEVEVWRVNEPYPLPVSWSPADTALGDNWAQLQKLARSGAGFGPLDPAAAEEPAPNWLSGQDNGLVELLPRIPTGRLLVLGEPGAGKSILMVRLALDLVVSRASGGPIPLLIPLASWDPEKEEFYEWLFRRLRIDHRVLADSAPEAEGRSTWFEALIAKGLALLLLDGLDEIPDTVRGLALRKINDAVSNGQHLVVTCRIEEYMNAISPHSANRGARLRGAAAIQLNPLSKGVVVRYLLDDSIGPQARMRWAPVIAALYARHPQPPVASALLTPLMASMARVIYSPRPGEEIEGVRDPEELCSPSLASREAVELILLDGFIPAAYRLSDHWTGEQAQPWLGFLASHLQNTTGTADFAWWQLREAKASGVSTGAAAGLVAGVMVGLLAAIGGALLGDLAFGIRGGFLLGIGGLISGIQIGRQVAAYVQSNNAIPPSRGLHIRWKHLIIWLIGISALGTLAGQYFMHARLVVAVLLGLVLGIDAGVEASKLAPIPNVLSGAASPGNILAADRQAAIIRGVTMGLTTSIMVLGASDIGFGRVAWLTSSFITDIRHGSNWWAASWHYTKISVLPATGNKPMVGHLNGLITGLALGLCALCWSFITAGQMGTAWATFVVARSNLALRHSLPYTLMDFLADAHRRGVLRQVGSVYQFRHIRLQRRLAARHEEG